MRAAVACALQLAEQQELRPCLHGQLRDRLEREQRSVDYSDVDFWTKDSEFSESIKARASSLVTNHILSVRCGKDDVEGMVSVGPSSFSHTGEGAMLHVWKSRREARRFHEALRRVAQAKFEHMIPSPIHVPLAALVCHQGAYVSVVWLPPLLSSTPVRPDLGDASWALVELLRCAMCTKTAPAVFIGADLRLYVMSISVLGEPLSVPAPTGGNRQIPTRLALALSASTVLDRRTVVNDDIPRRVIPAVASALLQAFEDGTYKTTAACVAAGGAGTAMHAMGLNVALLPLLATHLVCLTPMYLSAFSGSPGVAPHIASCIEAVKGEMVARTLKQLVLDAVDLAPTPEYAPPDLARYRTR
jgi:hypothetical protein